MKPITADNNDGRVLLALRAGEMTPGELAERGLHFPGWLITAGYVARDDDYYRITEAGRAACPFRNPLAATVVAPAKQEINMPKENIVTRQEVLAAIVAAGPAGTTCKRLIEQFNCGESFVIENHVWRLGKAAIPVIFKPEKGRIVAIKFNHLDAGSGAAVAEPEKPVADAKAKPASALDKFPVETVAMLRKSEQQAAAQRAEDLMPAMPELAAREETIVISDIQDRRAPVVIDSPDNTVFGMFSSGEMEITDSFHSFKLTAPVVAKMRGFLGLFAEVA